MGLDLKDSLIGRFLTVLLFVTLSIAGIIFSIYLFYVAHTPYLYLLAASFTLLSLVAGFFNVYASVWYFRSYFYDAYLRGIESRLPKLGALPSVAIAIPVYNEDPGMVERNARKLLKMNYPKGKMHFYLLDDSTDKEKRDALSKIAKKNGIAYLHRNSRRGFKAGALNDMLRQSKEEYLAVFDADEDLVNTNFLIDTLPYFADGKVSYVQTEKRYSKNSFFSDSVDIFDAFFFKFIQPARALNNTAVFAGSCGLISRKALDKIGGFPEYIIEDTFFSFESDMHEYKSLYLPKVYALGRPIKTFTELVKQQWRYNYGDTQFIGYFFKRKGYTKGSPLSNLDYITHGFGLNYLSIVLIMFTIVSIGIVFSALPFAHFDFKNLLSSAQLSLYLELLGFFAFTLSLLTPVLLTRIYFRSFKKGFMVFLLNYALAFVRTKAAISTLLQTNPGINWNRSKFESKSGNAGYSISNTKSEIAFASTMFVLGGFALSQFNISGGIWLIWYGVLYSLSTFLLYKYG
ncbi:MAG: glycosyltransferase [Candidatus Micrarchaeota archaeon]|nr:glycosyltransferase [Candidatus Micrarchaeota archaeon]MDE1847528.1 glycosyltransferase [Candidatus Micrarchaeota archaeon]MDE1863836.1 glycosyltransferase [Candidatus Micrarchaeota archaeon]